MEFYPIILMQKAIEELENEIKQVVEKSIDENYIQSCKFVNNYRIIQLKSAISFLEKAENIPIVNS